MVLWSYTGFEWHEHAFILRVSTGNSKHRHAKARKPDVGVVALISKLSFECWPMEERERAVHMPKKEVNEVPCEVRFRKLVEQVWKVFGGGDVHPFPSKFPLG